VLRSPAPDLSAASTLLLDADTTLVACEEPAYAAAAGVRMQLLHRLGATRRWDADRLREEWRGRSFRRIVIDLAVEEGVRIGTAEIDDWVAREERCVTARLGGALEPDPAVRRALDGLRRHRELAAIASTTRSRLDTCLAAAGLDELFPHDRRFSGEDSLALAASKPDPAVHLHALFRLGVRPAEALAVESTRCGVRAAVAAELTVVGNLAHVPVPERAARRAALLAAGARTVVDDWRELASLLAPAAPAAPADPAIREAGPGEVSVPRPRQASHAGLGGPRAGRLAGQLAHSVEAV